MRQGPGRILRQRVRVELLTARVASGTKSPFRLLDGTSVHGLFFGQSSLSKLTIVAESSIIKIDASGLTADDVAALVPLGCGYLTGAGTVFNVLEPMSDHTMVVLGTGAVGCAAIMAAKESGAGSIIAVDLIEAKLQLARTLGATHTINTSTSKNLTAAIIEIHPDGVDKIIDTTGSSSVLNDAFKALAHDGTMALVGVPPPDGDLQINALDLLAGCRKVIGVIEGSADPEKVRS